jgi:hypothetical protein
MSASKDGPPGRHVVLLKRGLLLVHPGAGHGKDPRPASGVVELRLGQLRVICWEALAAGLFWLAWRTYHGPLLYPAFAAGLSLWAAFLLADEAFVAYAVAAAHWRLFTAQLVTLLAVELLPEAERPVDRR